MLELGTSLVGKSVMSLRTGDAVARIVAPIINPNNLRIEGFYCEDRFEKGHPILLTQDIRDSLTQGLVVNDHESLTHASELVRLQDILQLNFQLIGKHVVTTNKERVGKITDFAVETSTFYVQKLYVGQSLLKSLSAGQLSIDRSQVVEINNKKIVIQELLRPRKSGVAATAPVA